jgi:hypothetical protein
MSNDRYIRTKKRQHDATDATRDTTLQTYQSARQAYDEANDTRDRTTFDERIGDAEERSTTLDEIIYGIRSTSDRVSGETWYAFYDRTRQLGMSELTRRQTGRRMTAYERIMARLSNPYSLPPTD